MLSVLGCKDTLLHSRKVHLLRGPVARLVQQTDINSIAQWPDRAGTTSIGPRGLAWVQPNHTYDALTDCIQRFPEGAFVSEDADAAIGFVSAIRLPAELVLSPHEWTSITANGTGASHDEFGDWLYACRLVLTVGPGHAPLMDELIPLLQALIGLAKATALTGVAIAVPFPGFNERSGTTEFQRASIAEPHDIVRSALHPIGCAVHVGFRHEIALPRYLGGARHAALMTWRTELGD